MFQAQHQSRKNSPFLIKPYRDQIESPMASTNINVENKC